MAFFSPSLTPQQSQQLGLDQSQGNTLFNNANSIFGTMFPAYSQILANPGYTPTQISSLYAGALQPISGAYGSAAGNLDATAARTRNDAGLYSAASGLATQTAQKMGQAGANVSTQVANYPREQTFKALSGLQSLYNPTLSAGTNLYNYAGDIANKPNAPSGLSDLFSTIGDAGSVALTGLSAAGAANAGPFAGLYYPPSHAKGGPVKRGKAVIVGEKGEELFVPSRDGRIVPHNKLMELYGHSV